MLKKFLKSDITTRPFTAYKNWTLQSIDSASIDAYGDSTWYGDKMEIDEGLLITGSFYDSASIYYNSGSEPINSSGQYKRIVYSQIDAMFYRNLGQPSNLFGVTQVGQNPITHAEEVREIHNRILAGRIVQTYWGEAINPKSVILTDYSNPHEVLTVLDDGLTNLFLSGSHFPYTEVVYPYNSEESHSYWNTASGEFFYNGNRITYGQAQEVKAAGGEITYVPDSGSWLWNYYPSVYHPENERFGYDVAAWDKYVLVGCPVDSHTPESPANGRADLYKYDPNKQRHRWINTFTSPFTTSIQDGFGHGVSVHDDFAVVGSPNENIQTPTGSGVVYIYGKYKGGCDNWGLINMISYVPSASAQFGYSVSHDNGVLAVGAPAENNNAGSVYIYRLKQYTTSSNDCMGIPTSSFVYYMSGSGVPIISQDGLFLSNEAPISTSFFIEGNYIWLYEAIITSSNPGDRFGSSVSISEDRLLIGTHITSSDGYAMLYTASYYYPTTSSCPTASWNQYKTLVGNTDFADLDLDSPMYFQNVPLPYNGFGYRVAIDHDQLAVCSFYDTGFTPYLGSGITQSLGAVYFYSFGIDPDCGFYDCSLRYKTYGDRSAVVNNNFARSVSISNGYASVGYSADNTVYSSSLVGGVFILGGWDSYSTSALDETMALGRVSIYTYNAASGSSWDLMTTMKQNKQPDNPYFNFGFSTSLSNAISGSMFLAVGGPVFSFPSSSAVTAYIEANSGSVSASLHGAAYIYDISQFDNSPKIGNVFYQNGQLVITSTASNYNTVMTGTGSTGFSLDYQGTQTIYEHEYLVTIGPGQCNYSTNPSSLANYPLLFDVNQDGFFDAADVNLILGYLNQQKYYIVNDKDDNALVFEQDTLLGPQWWDNQILQTESGDVLNLESLDLPPGTVDITPQIEQYILTNLIDNGALDIDLNGVIDIRDGGILLNYFLDTLTAKTLTQFLDANSKRVYYNDIKTYLDEYTGKRPFDVSPNFFGYIESSSFDLTGSYLAPYITSIGLYDDSGELAIVGKLGNPIKSLVDWPMNIIVRFDT